MHSFLPSVDAEFKSIPNPVHVPSRFELPKRQQRRTMALTGTGTAGSGTVFFLLLSIISPKLLIRFRWHFSRLFIAITCTFWPNFSSVGRLLYDLESNDTRPTHPRQSRAEPCFTQTLDCITLWDVYLRNCSSDFNDTFHVRLNQSRVHFVQISALQKESFMFLHHKQVEVGVFPLSCM